MALSQAHLHRHGGTATCRKTIAGHDGKGVIQWARWPNNDGQTWNGSCHPTGCGTDQGSKGCCCDGIMIQIPQKVRGVGYPLDEELALAWGLTHELEQNGWECTVPASGFGQKQGLYDVWFPYHILIAGERKCR